MERNVLLVTLQDNFNIGNRLQHFALQSVLNKRYDVNIVNLDNGYSALHKGLKIYVKDFIKYILSKLGNEKYKQYFESKKNKKIRFNVIKQFTNKYIDNIARVNYKNVYHKNWSEYDLAIVGSDQVWHKWKDTNDELPYYYLEFLPTQKRVAYAASFGFDSFPIEDQQQHIKGLRGMKYISCREDSGCKLAESVTDRKIPHVLDPTLLLNSKEWRNLSKNANSFSKNQTHYAFTYFLGELTSEYRNEIQNKVKKYDLKLIDFTDINDERIADCGPAEFLSLIDRADYVFTDSFHCTVFSILFDKHFEVFRRKEPGMEKMFSRIEELVVNTNNSDKVYGGVTPGLKAEKMSNLRKKSLDYLDKVMK